MDDRALALYSFIQERYLWQFYSRTWDREENINGIMNKFFQILSGETSVSKDSKEQYFYAEAVTVANETQKKFPWLEKIDRAELEKVIEDIKAKLIEVTVIRSQNGELNVAYY